VITAYTGPIGKGAQMRSDAGIELRIVGDLASNGWPYQVVAVEGRQQEPGGLRRIGDDELRRRFVPATQTTAAATDCPDLRSSK
jgi:hypothetical protein